MIDRRDIFPEEKIRQAFDLFLSLNALNANGVKTRSYFFEVSDLCVSFYSTSELCDGTIRYFPVYIWEKERIDELIDMIEEELDAKRSERNEKARCRDRDNSQELGSSDESNRDC